MAQNVYDDADFFAGYAGLARSVDGLDAAPEWPALRSMLPPIDGLDVVDLGCGYGWFARWAANEGAASVLGIDLSERMLARATTDTDDDRIAYQRADLDEVELTPDSFDLAYSSLAFHYLTDVERLFVRVARSLRPGGRFVFSCEHPILTAPSAQAFIDGPNGRVWALDHYQVEGERVTNWLADGVVKQHRTLSTYFTALRHAGFDVTDLVEWRPSATELVAHPDWAMELHRPTFLLIGATRTS
ncbi:MAG: class I SAM-dependent methyltransferase [Ilumatobacteraceae bacterium]